jgi:antitoxin (DNA-binding transcriptional repressor) of toxin-antitoxin stability system
MSEESISVTEAARNFSDCINRARYQGTTFILLKGGKPVATLKPESKKICTAAELADALELVELTPAESVAWKKDLAKARSILLPPADPWN